jgi:BirA family transcriptional regulator, biotin operon repressor / biotin---[acetyl-CoA-carboxylase] ligase
MTAIIIPDILNQLAQADVAGISASDLSADEDLELCSRWGYRVETNKGRIYLPRSQDSLIPFWIKNETSAASWPGLTVAGFFEIESTNDEALARARAGAPEGCLVFSEMQASGRGRIGRSWFSAPGAGLYFSLVLRPSCQQRFWPLLTHAVSVALSKTLMDLRAKGLIQHELAIDLKWPNDVFIAGRKVAGILLESAGNEAAVVGIGVNVSKLSVPEALIEQATSLEDEAKCPIPRRWLMVQFLHNFGDWYRRFNGEEFGAILDQWKKYSSMWNNTPIWILEDGGRREAMTCGLSEMGALKIRTAQGKEEILLAGDVSIRRLFEARKES